jgi:hypothetical protein
MCTKLQTMSIIPEGDKMSMMYNYSFPSISTMETSTPITTLMSPASSQMSLSMLASIANTRPSSPASPYSSTSMLSPESVLSPKTPVATVNYPEFPVLDESVPKPIREQPEYSWQLPVDKEERRFLNQAYIQDKKFKIRRTRITVSADIMEDDFYEQ